MGLGGGILQPSMLRIKYLLVAMAHAHFVVISNHRICVTGHSCETPVPSMMLANYS